MREIKFRLWNGASMEPVGSLTFHTDGSYHVNDEYPVNDKTMQEQFGGNRYYLMAYTGLCDKNGMDMYEGDIVEHNDRRYEITFQRAAFHFKDKEGGGIQNIFLVRGRTRVIGNVYENPKLLN